MDDHPEFKNQILPSNEIKYYSLFQQPNRLKFMCALSILALGPLLAAIEQTFDLNVIVEMMIWKL
mgnify:CR=1 FL=1